MVHTLWPRPKTSAGLPTSNNDSSHLLSSNCTLSTTLPQTSSGVPSPEPEGLLEQELGYYLPSQGTRHHSARLQRRSLCDIFTRGNSLASFYANDPSTANFSSTEKEKYVEEKIQAYEQKNNNNSSSRFRSGLEEAKGALSAMARKALQTSREMRPVERLNSLGTHDSSMSTTSIASGSADESSRLSSTSRPTSALLHPRRSGSSPLMTRPLTRLRSLRDRARRNAISLRSGNNYARGLSNGAADELIIAAPQQRSPQHRDLQIVSVAGDDQDGPLQHVPLPSAPGSAARASAAEHNSHHNSNNNKSQTQYNNQTSFDDLPDTMDGSEKMTKKRRAGKGKVIATGESVDLDAEMGVDEFTERRRSKPPTRMDLVGRLPTEIAAEVLSYLDDTHLQRCLRVSKRWNQLAQTPAVWRASFLGRYSREDENVLPYIQFGGQGLGREPNTTQEWQKMSQARKKIGQNWTMKNPKAVYFTGHTDSVYCCQFDEDKIITGSRDRTIRVWDLNYPYNCRMVIGGPAAKPQRPPSDALLETHPTNTVFSTPNLNGTAAGDAIYHVPSDYHTASILCLQFDHEIMVTGSSDHSCIVWDIKTFEPIRRLHHHTAGVLDVCMDEQYIISCSKDAHICVWDRQTFTLIKALHGHRGPVNAVQLRVIDGKKLLVSASGDGLAKIWDLEKLEVKQQFNSQDRGLAAVEFSDDGQYVLAGGNDQVIYKFSTTTNALVHTFRGHSSLVRSLFLDSANGRVVSGSYDQGIRVYDFESGILLGAYDNWTTSWILAAKGDYRRIVATSQDGRALLMDFGWGVKDAELLSRSNSSLPKLSESANTIAGH